MVCGKLLVFDCFLFSFVFCVRILVATARSARGQKCHPFQGALQAKAGVLTRGLSGCGCNHLSYKNQGFIVCDDEIPYESC